MRGAALQLAVVMLVIGAAACGRTNLDDGPGEPPADASVLDAAPDANHQYLEATVADTYVAPDEGTPADAALEGSPSLDATAEAAEGPDANTDASTNDTGDASEGGAQHLSCDQCPRGDQQCARLPQVCTKNDAGGILHCDLGEQIISTCVVGDGGCAVWDEALSCGPDIPCCTTCMYIYLCPTGGPGNPCQQDTDCVFDACDAISHQCVFDQCGDHRLDGQETDVDCGGPLCSSCTVNRRCRSNIDCQSGHLCGSSHLCE
jgi:hypothetical protein